MTKFIVVASSKGGVGKTTTAINLGTALTSFGREVIVVDLNVTTPNVSLYLGAPHAPVTLHDVLEKNLAITDALYMHSNGLHIIPASQSIHQGKVDYEQLSRLISSLSGMADYVILDSAAGIGEESLTAMQLSDEVLVVSTPDLPAISDALRTIHKAKEHNLNVKGVILTRVYDDELELSKKDVEAMLEAPVVAMIPEDDAMRESIKMKNPVTHTHPNAPSSIGYKELAAQLLGEKYVASQEKKDTLLDYALKRFGIK